MVKRVRIGVMVILVAVVSASCGSGGSGTVDESSLPTLFDIDQAATEHTQRLTESPSSAATQPPQQNLQPVQQPESPQPTTPNLIPTVTLPPVNVIDESVSMELVFWQAAGGRLEAESPDVWSFNGMMGDQIAVRLIGLNALLTLQDANGETLASAPMRVETTLPETATYTVLVLLTEGGGGVYQIGLSYTDRPNPADVLPTALPQVVGVPTPRPAYAELGTFISRLSSNETVGGTFDEASTRSHIYTFDGSAGDFVLIEMNRVSGQIDPLVTLYDPEGIPIAMDDDSGIEVSALLRNIQLPADGIYSIEAANRDLPGSYSIRMLNYPQRVPLTPTVVIPPSPTPLPSLVALSPAPAVIGNRLEDHSPVANVVLQSGDVAIYPIYAALGEVFTVGVSPTTDSTLRPEIEMVDPDGNIVAVARSSGPNAAGNAIIPNYLAALEGTYQVFVRGEEGSIGDYIIGYGAGPSWREVFQREAIFGERNEAAIEQRGMRHIWLLKLRAGDIITATVNPQPGSPLDPVLELVSAEDTRTILAIDDNGGGNLSPLLRDFAVQESGIYFLRVKSAQPNLTGGYTLIWRYVNAAPTETAPPGVALLLSVDDVVNPSEYRFYPFQGFAGQRIRVTVQAVQVQAPEETAPASDPEVTEEAPNLLDPVAALIGPGGAELIIVDDTNGSLNPTFDFELPEDSTYNIRVNGYIEGGEFTLVVEQLF